MKYLTFLLSIFLCCCSNDNPKIIKNNPDLVEIKVDVNQADTLKMSDFFSGIKYYHLKNPDNEPMGMIFKIMFQGDYIALNDQSKKSVWIYTKNGRYVNEVKIPQGRGAGELEHITDVYFDNEFQVHALGAFKLMVLDIDGNLIQETILDLFVNYLTYNEGNYYGYSVMSLYLCKNRKGAA